MEMATGKDYGRTWRELLNTFVQKLMNRQQWSTLSMYENLNDSIPAWSKSTIAILCDRETEN